MNTQDYNHPAIYVGKMEEEGVLCSSVNGGIEDLSWSVFDWDKDSEI